MNGRKGKGKGLHTYRITATSGIGERQFSFTAEETASDVWHLIDKLQRSDGIIRTEDGGEWDVIGARVEKIELVS